MVVSESVSIPRRFNGPLDSGNGGYSCGLFAGHLPEGPAEVSLRSPVPLETPLEVEPADGRALRVLDGETLIAEARAVPAVELDVPDPVTVHEARLATARYQGKPDGVFCRCFVCGRAREDAFGVFAGAVSGREVVASPWTPRDWTADEAGSVLPEFVWAVLDCPTYFASYMSGPLAVSVLARMSARLDAPVAAGREHVVIGWPIGAEGRKRFAGSAVMTPEGEVLAVARVLLIEPREG